MSRHDMTFGLEHVKISSGRSAPLSTYCPLGISLGVLEATYRTFMTSYITIANTIVCDVLLTFSSRKAWALELGLHTKNNR